MITDDAADPSALAAVAIALVPAPRPTSTHRHRRARVHPRLLDGLTLPRSQNIAPQSILKLLTWQAPSERHGNTTAPQLAHPHRAANTRPGARLRPRTRPQP